MRSKYGKRCGNDTLGYAVFPLACDLKYETASMTSCSDTSENRNLSSGAIFMLLRVSERSSVGEMSILEKYMLGSSSMKPSKKASLAFGFLDTPIVQYTCIIYDIRVECCDLQRIEAKRDPNVYLLILFEMNKRLRTFLKQ